MKKFVSAVENFIQLQVRRDSVSCFDWIQVIPVCNWFNSSNPPFYSVSLDISSMKKGYERCCDRYQLRNLRVYSEQ